MNYNDIYLVSHKQIAVTATEVTNLKNLPDFAFPEDLCDFLLRFGPGEFCDCYNIFGPEDLEQGQAIYRRCLREGFFFDVEQSALSQEEALQSTWIGRSLDGDEIVYRESGKQGFYILPRHSEVILKLGDTFQSVLEWFSSSGAFYTPSRLKWFCTFKDRCRLHLTKTSPISNSEATSLLDEAFGVTNIESEEGGDLLKVFCRPISARINVYTDNMDISHDLDFDSKVCAIAETSFSPLGFRSVEHSVP